MTDPIADMLTRIRNAQLAKKSEVVIPYSRIKFRIAEILYNRGYVGKLTEDKENHEFSVELKYNEKKPAIQNLKKISKPGCRVYVTKDNIPKVLNGFGLAILSTSKGLLTDAEAKKVKIGGELICEIY